MRVGQFVVVAILSVLAGCSDRSYTPTVPDALAIGTNRTIFAATTRAPGPDGSFGPERSEELSLLELTVSIPPDRQPGELDFAYGNPKPDRQFTMAGRREFASETEFRTRLKEEIRTHPSDERDITLFVHGFNSTQAETAFRAAQLAEDIRMPGATVVYSWPSLGSPLGYAYDGDSVLFARDGLEQLIRSLKRSNGGELVIVAHSMGSQLVMDTLRQIEIADPGWTAAHLGGVVLMSPDLDVEVFRAQAGRFEALPQPFIVFSSRSDKILNLSQRMRGTHSRERLGNLESLQAVADLPIEVIDITAFEDGEAGGHFSAASSPALIALLNAARTTADAFGYENVQLANLFPGRVIKGQAATEIEVANVSAGGDGG
jgi:esterase/lipase superfamily enzyme